MINCREMLELVEVLAREKNVEEGIVFGVLEMALASAVKKARFPGEDADIVVHVDRDTGTFEAARRWLDINRPEETDYAVPTPGGVSNPAPGRRESPSGKDDGSH